jgi:hypothetical protein
VIIHQNYAPSSLKGTDTADLTSRVTGTLTELIEDGSIAADTAAALRIHLDWVQYKTSFRDPVMVRRSVDHQEQPLPLTEIAIDLRQLDVARLTEQLIDAVAMIRSGTLLQVEKGGLFLGPFKPWRDSILWPFNSLFWKRLDEWENYAKRGFEAALPSGGSDANHPEAVADSVGDFWTLLRDLEQRNQLPAEVYAMELGVGSGARARLWLDTFKTLDDECGGRFYGRLRFLLGDYSPSTLDTALAAVGPHAPLCSVIPIDAHNPFKTLSFLRFKILFIHLTNVYDNLSFDEFARRDGQLYIVEVRPYLGAAATSQLCSEFGLTPNTIAEQMTRLIEYGPQAVGGAAPDASRSPAPQPSAHERGMAFWNAIWTGIRLEERLRAIDIGEDGYLPPGVSRLAFEDLLAESPQEIRFHLARGAAQSFVNTAPLLHPRGYLQVQDIFVSQMKDYLQGFRGPGKLDGSFVAWVNGAFLRTVGARAGYDVHFSPFKYRKGSKTQILYTTPRE